MNESMNLRSLLNFGIRAKNMPSNRRGSTFRILRYAIILKVLSSFYFVYMLSHFLPSREKKDMPRLESDYQHHIIKRLETLVGRNGYVFNLDGSNFQGCPDVLVLYKKRWAALECKRSRSSPMQPNQDYYIDDFDRLSFASFIYPENEDEVIHDLQQALRLQGRTRVP